MSKSPHSENPSSDRNAPPDARSGRVNPPTDRLPELSIGSGVSATINSAPEPPKLDGYEVHSLLGEGGMGSVWKGVQLSTRRNVALKIISAAAFAIQRARQRFDREVEITAKLEHPNIARVYDSGINRGVYFYAMELIDGIPLDQYIKRRKLTRPEILRLFAAICRGVQYAHQRGVIHRDLKAGNILVSSDGQPHVLDFGLAKALQQADKDAGISRDGEISGTVGYMSPEQAGGLPNLDARCDVYSLGVLLYQSLTGATPHDMSGTYIDVLRRVTHDEPKRPRLADRTIDPELEALLLCALQRDPRQRYRNAGELAQDIDNYLNGDPISAKRATLLYFAGKRVRKHRVPIVVTSILLVLAVTAGVLGIRLHMARLARAEQERLRLDASRKAAEDAHKSAVADAKAKLTAADLAFRNGTLEQARQLYQSAVPFFRNAGLSMTSVELGLWDVGRLSPQPLLTIAAPLAASAAHGSTPKVSVNSGGLIFLADNRHALAGCDDGSVRLWDAASGRSLQIIAAHENAVRSVSASSDAALALSGGAGGAMKLWDLTTGTLVTEFHDPSDNASVALKRVALSGDGRLALCARGKGPLQTGASDDTLTLWDAKNAKLLFITDRAAGALDVRGSVTQSVFSPDGSRVMTAGGEVAVWNVSDGKRIATMPFKAMSAAFSGDGNWIAAGSSSGAIRLLNIGEGRIIDVARGGAGAISAIWCDPAKDRILIGTEDGGFREVDTSGNERWAQPPGSDINAVAISPDGRVALTAVDEGLSVWRLAAPPEARLLGREGAYTQVCLSRDVRLALARRISPATLSPAEAALFDVATGQRVTPADFPSGACNGTALSRDGRTIAHVSGAALTVWSLDPPQESARFTIKPARNASEPTEVAVSNDGKSVAVCAADNSVLVYHLPGSTEPTKLAGHEARVNALDFSGDGHLLITAGDDRTARIWDVQTGQTLSVLRGHAAAINAVAFFDDGRTAVTGSGARLFQIGEDNSVRLWDVASGTERLILRGPDKRKRIRSVGVSGDGRLIASSDEDQIVLISDADTGEIVRTIRSTTGPVSSLGFDQNGRTLLCGSMSLSVWNFAHPARQRDLAIAMNAIHRDVPPAPADSLTLGRWYSLERQPAWASLFLHQALAAGQPVSALELSESDWNAGNLAAAEREMNSVSAQEAPAFYVKLCAAALRRQMQP